MSTGTPTIGQLKVWSKGNYQRMIALAIAIDARAVYDYLKANGMLGANWTKGAEENESSKLKMGKILNDAAVASRNPLMYVGMVIDTLPEPMIMGNPKAIQNVKRLLQNNPV